MSFRQLQLYLFLYHSQNKKLQLHLQSNTLALKTAEAPLCGFSMKTVFQFIMKAAFLILEA